MAQILPDDQMPVLPDGRHVDVCLNPLGVISRMNVGQLMEMHVGNILDRTRKWLEDNQNDTQKCVDMLCELFTLMDGHHDKRLSKQTTGMLKSLPKQEQDSIIQGYIKNGVKLIFPTFENPKMKDIQEAAKLVGAELESQLYLPRYGRKTMYPVTWGLLYILKLEHISSTKQNIRTVGSYKGTTNMPNKPGSGKNALRIGEQDS